jgi:signal transduction histidine kinase/ActR/RegA family two-component response regulator
LSEETANKPLVLHYVYAILAIMIFAFGVAISFLYAGQQSEIETRDVVQSFHLESVAEAEQLAREARTLLALTQDTITAGLSNQAGAAGIQSVQIGYRGVLYSMRTRLELLSALQARHGGLVFATALQRLVDRLNKVEHVLRDSAETAEMLTSIEVLSSSIEQYDRLHKIAADTQLRELADRQGQRPRYLVVLTACLAFGGLATGSLVISLRASLARQRATEEALAESQERFHHVQKLDALGRLVGGVAHDFNNLLMAILGHTDLLQEKAEGDERLEQGLDEIRQSSLRAASLTQQLLAFSRRQQFKPVTLNLNDVVRNMADMLRRIIGADVELTVDSADNPCAVKVDPDQLQQVIMNLISNARDAMPHGGVLSVTTENVTVGEEEIAIVGVPAGKYAKLCVSDSGIGMDDYTRLRLFEPYFTTKETGQGTGLGLSTVHGIVTGCDGHIVVDSQEGEGSRFCIYLPSTEGHPEVSPDDDFKTVPQTGSETVLVVEDEEQILQFVETGLSSLGYRVLAASSGAAGLEICRTEPGAIDAILSDVVMSETSGPRFMADALRIRPDAVAIYMSAYTKDAVLGLRRRSRETQIPLITKPFDAKSLSRLIRECLDKSDDAGPQEKAV